MDKFISSDLGGLDFFSDDLRFEQNSYRLAIEDMIKSLEFSTPYAFVVYGCRFTDSGLNWDVEEGAVVFNGEIFHFPATTIAKDDTKKFYLTPLVAWDAAGFKDFEDGPQFNTYQTRRTRIEALATPPIQPYVEMVDFNSIIIDDYQRYHHLVGTAPWQTLPVSSYYSPYLPGTNPLRFKRRGNTVEIIGQIARNPGLSVSGIQAVATLPNAYHPLSSVYLPVTSSTGGVGWVDIQISGDIRVRGDINPITIGTLPGGLHINGIYTIP